MQKRADQTRRTILIAAAEKFGVRGYLGTRLEDVVAGRAVSKGAIYFHFSSKNELAAAIIRDQRGMLRDLAVALRPLHQQTADLLIEVSQRVADRLDSDPMTRASTRLACERHQIGPTAPTLFDSWITGLAEVLDDGKARGEILPETDCHGVAEIIVAAMTGLQRRTRSGEDHDDLGRLTVLLMRLILPSLVPPGDTQRVLRRLDAIDAN